jgi:hypothetical protein
VRLLRFPLVKVCLPILAVGLAVCATAAPAAADTTAALGYEAHGYVEPCTVGNEQEMYTECELCSASARNPQACTNRLGKAGYQKKCQTRIASAAWDEVWCIAKRPPGEAAPSSKPLVLALVVVAALLGTFLVVRRSRSNRRRAS